MWFLEKLLGLRSVAIAGLDLEREQALIKSVFPEVVSGPGGWGCHRCACLSRCPAQGVCDEHTVFAKLNESALSEWLRLGGLGFPLRDSFLTELSWRP